MMMNHNLEIMFQAHRDREPPEWCPSKRLYIESVTGRVFYQKPVSPFYKIIDVPVDNSSFKDRIEFCLNSSNINLPRALVDLEAFKSAFEKASAGGLTESVEWLQWKQESVNWLDLKDSL